MRVEMGSAAGPRTKAGTEGLMKVVWERGNLRSASERVVGNKGAAGVDAIDRLAFKAHLQQHWRAIKARLLAGTYIPQAVRRVDIAKPQGGLRTLGIPTPRDRFIEQPLHQVLLPIFEPTFPASSYGFRQGRSAHQAVQAAKQHVAKGRRVVAGVDLETFFDRVNHDVLMERVAREVWGVAARNCATSSASCMNRRMRNRMYGSVGGRRG